MKVKLGSLIHILWFLFPQISYGALESRCEFSNRFHFLGALVNHPDEPFDGVHFNASKEKFSEALQSGKFLKPFSESLPLKKDVDLFAFLEAVGKKNGQDLFQIESILRDPQSPRAKILLDFLASRKGMVQTEWDAGVLGSRLYLIANTPIEFWDRVLPRSLLASTEKNIQKRVESEVAHRRLSEAFQQLGMLKSNSDVQKFKAWKSSNPALFERSVAASVNAVGWVAFH